jgi:outer membrane protein assembly factor BamB
VGRSLYVIIVFVLIAGTWQGGCSSSHPKLPYTNSDSPDWLTPRANAVNTGSVGSTVTNTPYTVLWSRKTGGVAACEPIVRDGLLFFSGLDRRVEVYDLASGERRFRKRFDGPVVGVIAGDSTFGVLVDQAERRYFTFDLRTARKRANFRVPSVSAPPRSLSDTTILLGTWGGRLLCLSTSGSEIWKTECEGPIKNAPAVLDSVVYVSSGRSIFALRATDGAKLWEHGLGGAIEGSPSVDDLIYCGASDSSVTALRTETGDLVWRTHVGGGVFATPTVGDDLVFIASNDGLISALSKADGALRWTYNTEAVANLSPTLCGEYLLTTSRQSAVTMLSAATGEKVWSDSTLAGQAITSPVVVGDRIILTDSQRTLICLAPARQAPLTDIPNE